MTSWVLKTRITKLIRIDNRIGFFGALAISEALKVNHTLTDLDVTGEYKNY